MQSKRLFLTSLFLAGALIAPMAASINATPQKIGVRVYDRGNKDYHNWDDNEAKTYTTYRADHPKLKVTFTKNSRSDQDAYWKYRHENH